MVLSSAPTAVDLFHDLVLAVTEGGEFLGEDLFVLAQIHAHSADFFDRSQRFRLGLRLGRPCRFLFLGRLEHRLVIWILLEETASEDGPESRIEFVSALVVHHFSVERFFLSACARARVSD
jgi:hypothetical protein